MIDLQIICLEYVFFNCSIGSETRSNNLLVLLLKNHLIFLACLIQRSKYRDIFKYKVWRLCRFCYDFKLTLPIYLTDFYVYVFLHVLMYSMLLFIQFLYIFTDKELQNRAQMNGKHRKEIEN